MTIKFSKNSHVVVLTGAGISAESGLKTFRDNDGLWENHKVEDVATPEAFERDPELVYRFYNQRRMQLRSNDIIPNAAHFALTKLSGLLQENLLLVTQNVDNLHEKAKFENVIHMHGDLLSYRCCHSGQVFETVEEYDQTSRCACCKPANKVRPNIVWFGETPLQMDKIYQALSEADLFISIGTSGNVYPAAGFVQKARYHGAYCVELNLEPSAGHSGFDHGIYGKASKIVPQYIDSLIQG